MNEFNFGKLVNKFQVQLGSRFTKSGPINIFDLLKGKEGGSITTIFSALLPYLYLIAGLLLFSAIIIAGFQLLFSGGDPKKTGQAKGCLTNAVIGFLIIFVSWWLIQIIQIIFHLEILGS